LKICLVCSQGGHFDQMKNIEMAFNEHEYFYAVFRSGPTKQVGNTYYIEARISKLTGKYERINVFKNAFKILLIERPEVIVTTGGGEIAVPFCYLGKLFGTKIIVIESLTRTSKKSEAGRLIYPIADLVLVQWKELLSKYGDKAKYWGKVI